MALGSPFSTQASLGIYNTDEVPSLTFQSGATVTGLTASNLQMTGFEYIGFAAATAAGTTQNTATPITTAATIIASSGANSGVILPNTPLSSTGVSGNSIQIVNLTANTVNIYPATGHSINALSANAAYSLPSGLGAILGGLTSTSWSAEIANVPSAFQYNTNTATASATLAGADISGTALGFIDITLNLTGTLTGAANATLPTVANLAAALINPSATQQWKLRIINSSSGAFAWTVVTNTGWTLGGTMTIAQNTWRDFYVTFTSASTATLQSIGTGTYS